MEMANSGKRRRGVLAGGRRRWEDLGIDLLALIFSRVGIADLIAGVPYVCSSWWRAAREPFCWRSLDFREWDDISRRLGCERDCHIDCDDLLVHAIISSEEFIDSVHLPYFADIFDLEHLSNKCPELLYFSIENPDLSVDEFCKHIGKFKFLNGMAVDQSLICHQVLQLVNQCCEYFSELEVFSDEMDKQMASIICECLPKLRKLLITNCRVSRDAILTLLGGLKEIEYLDISGYELSGITSEVIEKASHLKVFRWDSMYDLGEFEYCSHCEEDYFFQSPCECVMDQQVMEWLANHL
ncbi:hypothetical protein KSP39_PZI021404 [Platanthera zijinensis]|uniref:F-box/LRR-repeat protein n=1 Tax=Platanthera zijinensis TaxID=2320716 RepID=A0AAP0AXN4_9ASPA